MPVHTAAFGWLSDEEFELMHNQIRATLKIGNSKIIPCYLKSNAGILGYTYPSGATFLNMYELEKRIDVIEKNKKKVAVCFINDYL